MSQSDFVRTSVDYGGWDPSSIFSLDNTGIPTREGENPNGSNMKLLYHEKCNNRNENESVSLLRKASMINLHESTLPYCVIAMSHRCLQAIITVTFRILYQLIIDWK